MFLLVQVVQRVHCQSIVYYFSEEKLKENLIRMIKFLPLIMSAEIQILKKKESCLNRRFVAAPTQSFKIKEN